MEPRTGIEENPERWERIFSSRHRYQAELLKGLLEENGIKAVIINKQDSAYLFGYIEVYVNMNDILRSQKILTQFLSND